MKILKIETMQLSGEPQIIGELYRTFDEVLNEYVKKERLEREDIISVVPKSLHKGSISYFSKRPIITKK